ncbi:MAG TPA: sigma-70 family RNA polymerase sigma factor [Polyangia bacterium]|nr:sigma-70 family RNA polymerase sigma factor [Polyangia bacterium]
MAEAARRSRHPSEGAARRQKEDAALVARAAKHDLAAFATLYRRFSGPVCALALGITRNRAEAEEVTQEVFWRVWQLASRFDPARGSVAAWVLSVTRNRALDLVRARASLRRTCRQSEPLRPRAPTTPEGELESLERTHQIQRVLERLPAPQREVLDLAYWGGLSHIEIATCTGTPLGTVKSRIALGMARLRAALRPPGRCIRKEDAGAKSVRNPPGGSYSFCHGR